MQCSAVYARRPIYDNGTVYEWKVFLICRLGYPVFSCKTAPDDLMPIDAYDAYDMMCTDGEGDEPQP